MKLKLINKIPQASDVTSFIFDKPQDFIWEPGQYLHYTLPHQNPDNRGVSRYFSIASSPTEEVINITTRFNNERSSSFKEALFKLEIGDEIEADELEGDFVVKDPQKKCVFIAGGIGITPFRAILKNLADKDLPINVTLIYANRNEEIVFKNEFEEIAKLKPEFKIHYLISPQKVDEETIKNLVPDLQDPLFYISGPAPMVFSIQEMLKNMNITEDKIQIDDFPGYD